MKWKLPRPSKACCCIPLRRGIIAFVYLNLVVALAAHAAFIMADHVKWFWRIFSSSQQEQLLRDGRSKSFVVTVLLLFFGGALSEFTMTIVALVGLHKKNIKVIKSYFFYTAVYTILMGVMRSFNLHVKMLAYDVPVLLVFLGFKFYYIMLLRSQIKKMEEANKKAEQTEVELNNVKDSDSETTTEERDKHSLEGIEVSTKGLDKYQVIDDTVQLVPEYEGGKEKNAEVETLVYSKVYSHSMRQ